MNIVLTSNIFQTIKVGTESGSVESTLIFNFLPETGEAGSINILKNNFLFKTDILLPLHPFRQNERINY